MPADDIYMAAADPEDGYARVKKLVEVDNVDLNQPHPLFDTTPIAFCVQSGNFETVKYLIEVKHVNIVADEGKPNIFYWALQNKDPRVALYVANLVKQFNDGTTHLHAAAALGNLDAIKLASSEENVNYQAHVNKRMETPLYYAAIAGRTDVIAFLTTLKSFQSDSNPDKYKLLKEGLIKRVTVLFRNRRDGEPQDGFILHLKDIISLIKDLPQLSDDDYAILVECYIALGLIDAKNKNTLGDALIKFSDAMKIGDHIIDARIKANSLAVVHHHLAYVYFDLGLFEDGLDGMQEELSILKKLLVEVVKNESEYRLASDYLDQNLFSKGIEVLKKLLEENNNSKKEIEQIEEIEDIEDVEDVEVEEIVGKENKRQIRSLIENIEYLEQQISLVKNAKEYGYKCKEIPGDGDCFFTAVASLIEHHSAASLRALTVNHVKRNQNAYQYYVEGDSDDVEINFNQYCLNMAKTGSWADHVAIQALSRELKYTFCIIDTEGRCNIIKPKNSRGTICVGFLPELHYCSLERQEDWMATKNLQELVDRAEIDDFVSQPVIDTTDQAQSESSPKEREAKRPRRRGSSEFFLPKDSKAEENHPPLLPFRQKP